MFKKNWIFYTHSYNENSGGSSVYYKLCLDMHKKGHTNFFLAPIFCRGDGMINSPQKHHSSELDKHGRSRVYIKELPDKYFNKNSYPEYIRHLIVTREILEKRDNIAVYMEGFIGNPLEQRYAVRWIMYFPTPGLPADPILPFGKNDNFLFWDLAYFRNIDEGYTELNDSVTYRKSDIYPEKKDLLFGSYTFLHDMIDLDTEKYKNLPNRKGSCHLIRKADPNYNRTFRQNWNWGKQYNENHPHGKPKPPHYIHPKDSTVIDFYGLKELINIFKQKKYFYCYDHYTFTNCLALLYGCTVIMCPPEDKGFSKEDWHCGNPSYLDYVAWGNSKEEIDKAEELNKKVNYGEIIKLHVKNKQEELFNSLIHIDNNLKTELNKLEIDETYTFDGSNCKKIKISSEDYYPAYTHEYNINEFIIELEFNVYSDNSKYANLFSFNYKADNLTPNMGPRLEYNNNFMAVLIGNKYSAWKGYAVSDKIIENNNYKLQIHYLNQVLTTSLFNLGSDGAKTDEQTIETTNIHKVLFKPTDFKDLVLGKGFNEERHFKGVISNFNFKFL